MAGLDEQVVLDNYENNFLHRMNEMRKQNILCDVRFIVKDKEFPCHKLMLTNAMLNSGYFQTLFNCDFRESCSETIPLQDVEPEAIDEILTAIYTTQFHLNRRNAYFILRASHMFHLTEIFNAVVSHTVKNPKIDFLVETCLFAQTAGIKDLYSTCIRTIATALNDFSKIDSFNEMITFELFMMILKNGNLIDDKEALFQTIMSWSKHNKSSQNDVLLLLNAADMRSGCLNTQSMATLIVNTYNATSNEIPTTTSHNENTTPFFVFGANNQTVYLNTIDVKSGAKGWATLESNLEFNEHKFINYQQSNSSYKKVKKVETKLYCFEYDEITEKNLFSCFENGEKTCLSLPVSSTAVEDTGKRHHGGVGSLGFKYYDIEAVNNFIYLITGQGELRMYNCETNYWRKMPIQNLRNDYNSYKSYYNRSEEKIAPKLTHYNGQLFVVGVWGTEPFSMIHNQSLSAQSLNKCPYKFTNPAVCCYNKNLVLCGSDHGNLLHETVSAYDMTAGSWRTLEKMNIGRANHTLNHHDGYLYAIENKSAVPNEKYEINLNKWTCIPSFPQRLNFTQGDVTVTLATGSVFNCTIE